MLMVDHNSVGPSLQFVRTRFSIFLLRKLSHKFKLCKCGYYTNFKWPFPYAWGCGHMVGHGGSPICITHADMTLTSSKVQVKVTDLLKFHRLHFSTSSLPFWHAAQNWWLIATVWDLVYSYSEPHFWISPQLAVTWLQSSQNVHCLLSLRWLRVEAYDCDCTQVATSYACWWRWPSVPLRGFLVCDVRCGIFVWSLCSFFGVFC